MTGATASDDPATSEGGAGKAGEQGSTTAFVLGGGGRWGAVEVGMLRALAEAGVTPDLIVGTSIGAINGAVFAADPGSGGVGRLGDLWAEVGSLDLFTSNPVGWAKNLTRSRVAVEDPGPLEDLLDNALPVSTFDELALPFECVAASIEAAAERWFSEGPLLPALLASSAVPVLFPPVEIEGEHFYDGGLVNSVPVDRAIDRGASTLYVLQVGRVEQPLRAPTKLYETALVSFEIARRHRFGSIRDNPPAGVSMHLLPSGHRLDFDDRRQVNWSDLGGTVELIEGAYHASAEYLAEVGLAEGSQR